MKRIAFISEHASPLAVVGGVDAGGQNIYIDRVAAHLSRMGYRIDVFTRLDDPSLPQVVEYRNGVRVIHIKAGPASFVRKEEMFPLMDEFNREMGAFIRSEGVTYDLIHAHFWMSGYVAALISASFGIPFVITFHALGKIRRIHQGEADEFPDIRFAVEESLVRRATTIFAECPQDREDLIRHYEADPSRITIVPCGFDTSEFPWIRKAEARNVTGVEKDEFVILQLGRMVPRKGIDNVIRAIPLLKRRVERNVKLLIVGGDAEEEKDMNSDEYFRLKSLAESLRVSRNVVFTGFRNRTSLRYYYTAADVFVTTPWYEPFGITPLEAMACATPVVGSGVGGIKFSVQDGETGFLVPPNDPVALAGKLELLCRYPALATKMGLQGRKEVNRNFTWEQVASSISDEYGKVLGLRRKVYQPTVQVQTGAPNHAWT